MTNRHAALVIALASAAVLTGCAVDTSQFRQGPIPEVDPGPYGPGEHLQRELPPEPDSDAPFTESIAFEALKAVSEFAATTDPDATYTCPAITGQESEITCTVTFLGESYDYIVTIEDSWELMPDLAGQTWMEYTTELPAGPVVRDVVEDYLRFSQKTEYVLCDIPDITKAEVGQEVGTCEVVDTNGYGTTERTVIASEHGFLTQH